MYNANLAKRLKNTKFQLFQTFVYPEQNTLKLLFKIYCSLLNIVFLKNRRLGD